MEKVLSFGQRVRLSSVDMNGYCGRELHPTPEDIGFLGVIVKNTWFRLEGGCLTHTSENVPPGTVLIQDDDVLEEGAIYDEVVYEVMAPDGRRLECVWHELEHIASVVS